MKSILFKGKMYHEKFKNESKVNGITSKSYNETVIPISDSASITNKQATNVMALKYLCLIQEKTDNSL